ncbi:MAG: efflux RND transporter periplasmic adaptor subunit, partial [Candidatus Paceibacterota bacterium]
ISAGDKLRESVSDVPVQVAKVNLAESRLSKAMLISPISGVVSKQDAKAGEAVSVGASLVSVISTDYEIETFVPEVSIAGVKVGNDAAVTLDAYGPAVKFKVSVTHIDPAETVRDGVSTYRVKLAFSEPDPRIRSGMTANTEVETLRKPGSMLIPLRAVVKSGDDASVHVLIADEESEKRAVTLGEKDSAGNVEVLSGVSASDRILINPPQK